jgi:hypothetical protein
MSQMISAEQASIEEPHHLIEKMEHMWNARAKELQTSEAIEEVILDLLTISLLGLPISLVLGFLAFFTGTDLYLVTICWALFALMFIAILLVALAGMEVRIKDREGMLDVLGEALLYHESSASPYSTSEE